MSAASSLRGLGARAARDLLVPAALGVGQIVAWGTLYYAIAVLGPAIAAELGLTMVEVHAGLTVGLVTAGVLGPVVGRLCDRAGARAVLVTSALAGALGLALLASARGGGGYFTSWLVIGVAMALGFYEPVFAALATREPAEHRRRIGVVAVLGGLASTASWPVTHALSGPLGWRGTLAVLALALAACAPLYYAFAPRKAASLSVAERRAEAPPLRGPIVWVGLAFTVSTLVMTALSVHLLGILELTGLEPADAVPVAAAMGVVQSLGRFGDAALGARVSTWKLGAITLAASAAAVTGLALAPGSIAAAIAFVVAFGAAAGVLTVVRGALPVQIAGPARAGAVLGALAVPTSAARAVGPLAFAMVSASGLGARGALLVAALVAWVALASYRFAWRRARAADCDAMLASARCVPAACVVAAARVSTSP